jgi:hypothetical protein
LSRLRGERIGRLRLRERGDGASAKDRADKEDRACTLANKLTL